MLSCPRTMGAFWLIGCQGKRMKGRTFVLICGQLIVAVLLSGCTEEIIIKFITNSKQINDTQKIFEAFHREDDVDQGFGLGLEIVGEICQKENVKIDVESDEQITVFSYTFRKGGTHESTIA